MGMTYEDVRGEDSSSVSEFSVDTYVVDIRNPKEDRLQQITTPPRYQNGSQVPSTFVAMHTKSAQRIYFIL